ncbi:putative colanic acid biosynthesis UDP-glucose lipid carrier transferase [Cupriavidus gilardii J11]|uniref:Putative colanic acid biosynthesis UDP-glucose lipid carrier transferase n=1 Tax=Cupriavidus gilardii J11 TaxID=936133 RepID=A0A562BRJ2_9BURK|nr:undecaprenyl-phosphate glucose phosphotransferase [Cupriavidus gilardii]TWG87498.1 putative colanic acid biosynthesis UDP-glucose lipid carrier transferase [Cupriavidus gilardii J11]TWG87500.1 putative colanic acid biosynthesis UDP-glucose lipid carrier transferase [Cupriavidus gilardii J11]
MATASAYAVEGQTALQVLYRASDALIVAFCGILVGEFWFPQGGLDAAAPVHGFLTAFCALATLVVFPACGLYGSWRGRSLAELALRTLAAWSLVAVSGLVLAYLMHQVGAVSRLWSTTWFATVLVVVIGSRLFLFRMLGNVRRQGINAKRVLIFGYGPLGNEMYRRVQQIRAAGYHVVGIYCDEPDETLPAGIPVLRSMADVTQFVRTQDVREIWLTLPMAACRDLCDVVYQFRNDLIDIRWVPDIMSVELLGHRFSEFLGLPVIDLNSPPDSRITGLLKASFDRVFAAMALLGLSPLLLAIALMVKLSSPGPVLFRQKRLGIDGKPFDVFKFRTMVVHQDKGVTQATRNDPRVTRIGAFLRRTSLDELPQFINVLRGEMSVVGPRPHALEHNEMYKELIDRYMLRHRVKPGITGWAQINGLRGQTDTVEKMRARIEFDIYYIRNWSFQLDLRIIARTALHGWTGKSAF